MSLSGNIHRLTSTHLTTGTDGKPVKMPALLMELEAAVKPGNDGSGNGSTGKPIPINAGAVDLAQAIRKDAQTDHVELRGFRHPGTITELLQSYLVPIFTDIDNEWAEYLEHVTLDWVDRIDNLVRPRKPRRKLGVACPHCEQKFHGEEREPALTVNCWGKDETMLPQGQWDAKCSACGAEWIGHDAMVWFLSSINQGGIAA